MLDDRIHAQGLKRTRHDLGLQLTQDTAQGHRLHQSLPNSLLWRPFAPSSTTSAADPPEKLQRFDASFDGTANTGR
jgi:hypothetical protein